MCSSWRRGVSYSVEKLTHEQCNNTVPQVATNCSTYAGWKRSGAVRVWGNGTRANTEDLLIATRGKGLERQNASVKQVIYSPLGEHSQKPAEARYRLEQLYGDVSRIELFSRCAAPGWHHWGNQSVKPDLHLIPGSVMHIDWAKGEGA